MQIFNAVPDSNIFIISSLNRIILFFILSIQLASSDKAFKYYKILFIGIFSGAVFSAIIGIFDCYNVIDLSWFRHDTTLTKNALHSTFLNRGWFAEFIVTVVPFVIIGFISKNKSIYWKSFLFILIIIVEIALFLSGSRSGWVSYPLVLLICWYFFYNFKDGRAELSKINLYGFIKIFISVPITIIVSIFIIFKVLLPFSDSFTLKNDNQTKNYLIGQTSRIIEPSGRLQVWNHGKYVGLEKPVLGMGYESFCWNGNILKKIPDSDVYKKTTGFIHDTPHNTLLQIFVGIGFVGLFIWLIIVAYILMILVLDLIINKSLFNIAIISSIISFHIIGFFQSMQYIPMIWLLIFLNFGYALTINEKILNPMHKKSWDIISKLILIFVLSTSFFYYKNSFSNTLQAKYGLNDYALDNERRAFLGYYHSESWPDGKYRWTGRKAVQTISARSDIIAFKLVAQPPNCSGPEGLNISIYCNNDKLDELHFVNGGERDLNYHIPGMKGRNIDLKIEVSRLFNPNKIGLNDDKRYLGVAVSEIQFIEEMPPG